MSVKEGGKSEEVRCEEWGKRERLTMCKEGVKKRKGGKGVKGWDSGDQTREERLENKEVKGEGGMGKEYTSVMVERRRNRRKEI